MEINEIPLTLVRPRGWGCVSPQRSFCNNFFNEKGYRNEILTNCQWVNKKCIDFYKMEHCPYVREGNRSILGTFEMKNR